MTNNQLTGEQLVTLQLRIMSALSLYRQRPEKEARRMAELLELAGAAASELQERRKADQPTDDERIMEIEGIAPPTPQPSRMSGIMPDYEGVAMTQRECYMAGKEAGLAEDRKSPVITDGYALVPVAYADPQAFINFKSEDGKNAACTKEWMWRDSAVGLIPLYIAPPAPVVAGGWIPVSERMPEREVDVQVYCADKKEQMVGYMENNEKDGYFRFASLPNGGGVYCKSTHWQPLPAAPKEVK